MGKKGLVLGSTAMAKFEQAKEVPLKEGFLEKRGAKNKAWKRRYITIKDAYLFYCITKEDNPQGIINLTGSTVVKLSGPSERKFSFSLLAPKSVSTSTYINRTFFFAAASESERQMWIDALQKASSGPEEKKTTPRSGPKDEMEPSKEKKEMNEKKEMMEPSKEKKEMNEKKEMTQPDKEKKEKKERREKKEKKDKKDRKEKKEKKEKNSNMTEKKSSDDFQQVGGHSGGFQRKNDKTIMKAVSPDELEFYSVHYQSSPDIRRFAPEFSGSEKIEEKQFALLEDLTFGHEKPCIMDIKMGTSSVDPRSPTDKRKQMDEKDQGSTTKSVGFRIVGLKIWDHAKQEYIAKDKQWGQGLSKQELKDALALYFHNGINHKSPKKNLPDESLNRIEPIYKWFRTQTQFSFYSSSLLFIYEGNPELPANPKVKMIDFAHVLPSPKGQESPDEGYYSGLKSLRKFLQELIIKEKGEESSSSEMDN